MDKTIEQQARELLAEEYERDEQWFVADCIRRDASLAFVERRALRAITRALTRPAPTEAEVEAAAKRVYELMPYDGAGNKPAWADRGNSLKQDEARRMARAALGVGHE